MTGKLGEHAHIQHSGVRKDRRWRDDIAPVGDVFIDQRNTLQVGNAGMCRSSMGITPIVDKLPGRRY
jgi:hypothetical protein